MYMYEGYLKVLFFLVFYEIVDYFKYFCYGLLNFLLIVLFLRKKNCLIFFFLDLLSFKNILCVIFYCLNLEKKVKYNSRNKKVI